MHAPEMVWKPRSVRNLYYTMISLKKKVLFSIFLPALLLGSSCMEKKTEIQHRTVVAMDTVFSFTVCGDDTAVLQDCITLLTRLSRDLDCFDAQNLIGTLNEKKTVDCPDDVLPKLLTETAALQKRFGYSVQLTCKPLTDLWGIATDTPYLPTAHEIAAAKNRIDDSAIRVEENRITLTMDTALDTGAVAKGYAMDQLAEKLAESSAEYAVISASSAVLLYGQKPQDAPFVLQITDPIDGGVLGSLTIRHENPEQITMIGTSGGYERYSVLEGKQYSHVMDLQTGAPTESDLVAVTVVCQNGLMADFLSTSLYLGGTEGLEQINEADYRFLAVSRDGTCIQSSQLEFTKGE